MLRADMTDEERKKWDERYATGTYTGRATPGEFLQRWVTRLPAGRALDIACGTGRHAFLLAEAGLQVDAVDISKVAVDSARAEAERRSLDIDWTVSDLDNHPLPQELYDVITVIRFVHRDLWPRLVKALRPGGMLLIEHHLRTPLDVDGPRSESFRLEPQELLRAFASLRVVFYEETLVPSDVAGKQYALSRMVACKGAPLWERS